VPAPGKSPGPPQPDGGSASPEEWVIDGYPGDISRNPADTEGYPRNNVRDLTGSDGYPTDTDGNPSSAEPPDVSSESEADRKESEYWERRGFSSLEEFLEETEADWDRVNGRTPPPPLRSVDGRPPTILDILTRRRKPPRSELPIAEIPEANPPRPRRATTKVRQVCVKLTDEGYESLAEAAAIYGVRPSTLARMLVHRGAGAVIEANGRRDPGS
jgi:hypothetical protein